MNTPNREKIGDFYKDTYITTLKVRFGTTN